MKSTFRELTTISGQKIFIRPNFAKKVFTIKTESSTYKTYKQDENSFNDNLFNTANDWKNYLRTSQDYFIIK